MSILFYILTAIAYAVLGVVWGFIRWKIYVDAEIEFYEQERQRFLRFHRVNGSQNDIPEFLIYEWRNYVKNNKRLKVVPPKAMNFRGEISCDVLCWPLAMVLLVVMTVYNAIMQRVLSEYNRITNSKIEKIRKDLNLKEKEKP